MKQKIVLVETAAFWSELYNYVMPAVVQVFSQVVPFNWAEPYRIQEPYDALGTGFLIDPQGHIIQVESEIPLSAAHTQPLTTEKLEAQLGRLGNTPFKLSTLTNTLEGDMMIDNALLDWSLKA